jgi:hypothetical protein
MGHEAAEIAKSIGLAEQSLPYTRVQVAPTTGKRIEIVYVKK